jgi:beta-glucosidase
MERISRRLPPRSRLATLANPEEFVWATGIEDTFVSEPHPLTGRSLDEYNLTEHYLRWNEDFALVCQLKVRAVRYGLPWYKISPREGEWDWTFADKTLNRLLEVGIDPIIDLVHYGTPSWMVSSFLNSDYPKHVAEYASKVAERYKGKIFWYTPLNEPRINAYYSGKLGLWPPHARGWKGFVGVLKQICKGIVLTCRGLTEVDPEIVRCHVDATDLYDPIDSESEEPANHRQQIVFLALDLITGRVDGPTHPLFYWLLSNGFSKSDLNWFLSDPVTLDVLGINLYPMFSLKKVRKVGAKTFTTMPSAVGVSLTERLSTMYWRRYRVPLMISETASNGSVAKRSRWLTESTEACHHLRRAGVELVGYTWWPMFSLVSWSYLASKRPVEKHIVSMGLWDLDPNLDRRETPLSHQFRTETERPMESIGREEFTHVS